MASAETMPMSGCRPPVTAGMKKTVSKAGTITAGSSGSPTATPSAEATSQHAAAMNIYLNSTLPLPMPSDLRQPICPRSSSIMRDIVVITTSAATRMKNAGNAHTITVTLSR